MFASGAVPQTIHGEMVLGIGEGRNNDFISVAKGNSFQILVGNETSFNARYVPALYSSGELPRKILRQAVVLSNTFAAEGKI